MYFAISSDLSCSLFLSIKFFNFCSVINLRFNNLLTFIDKVIIKSGIFMKWILLL